MSFDGLCRANRYREAPYEDISNPTADDLQDTWVRFLKVIASRGDLPNAQTPEELAEAYGKDGGLLVIKQRQTAINNANARKGVTPNKQAKVKSTVSLDVLQENDQFDTVEDRDADQPFSRIEAIDELQRFLKSLTKSKREAIDRFIEAWILQEAGEKIPHSLAQRISLDRKRTGFALRLR